MNTIEVEAYPIAIDGKPWLWIDDHLLFIRMNEHELPLHECKATDGREAAFHRHCFQQTEEAVRVPVERGDSTTICGMPVDDTMLTMIEKIVGGPADWRTCEGWLVARDNAGELAAVWKMPDGHGAVQVFAIEYDGDVWLCSSHFFLRAKAIPDDAVASLREHLVVDPDVIARMAHYIQETSAGTVMPIERDSDYFFRVGPDQLPRDQVFLAEANCGKDLEWVWTAETKPIAARMAGQVMAIIMPLKRTHEAPPPNVATVGEG